MKELKRRRGMVVRGTGGYGYESWLFEVLVVMAMSHGGGTYYRW